MKLEHRRLRLFSKFLKQPTFPGGPKNSSSQRAQRPLSTEQASPFGKQCIEIVRTTRRRPGEEGRDAGGPSTSDVGVYPGGVYRSGDATGC